MVLGGGGYKPKSIRALQENPKLEEENFLMRQISKDIKHRMREKELSFTDDYMDFEGDLIFNDEDNE